MAWGRDGKHRDGEVKPEKTANLFGKGWLERHKALLENPGPWEAPLQEQVNTPDFQMKSPRLSSGRKLWDESVRALVS